MKSMFETKLDWLRGAWENEHGYSKHPDAEFKIFSAPDLTAEEIKECKYEDLYRLEEYVTIKTRR